MQGQPGHAWHLGALHFMVPRPAVGGNTPVHEAVMQPLGAFSYKKRWPIL